MLMNSPKEIGGYFGFEHMSNPESKVEDHISLNCARNCLRYIIRAFNIKIIHLPMYTCPVIWQAANKENCTINYYHIDINLMPMQDFKDDDFIVYTNYFGTSAKNIQILSKRYKNLIVDNAQAFYMPTKYGIASFNSLRKFFGIPDGAFLYTSKYLSSKFDRDITYDRCTHLLKRADCSANVGYEDFIKNEKIFDKLDIKLISNLSANLYKSINLSFIKNIRLQNFNFLNNQLDNKFNLVLNEQDVPMVYPYYSTINIREKLISNKIYAATYWSDIDQNNLNSNEKFIMNNIIPLPIDQRYNEEDMKKIIEVINV